MAQNEKNNVGKYLYFDWLIPIIDYFRIIKIKEALFDIITPLILSIIVLILYLPTGLVQDAISALSEILPNVLAILIGFSISAIAIITTNNKEDYSKPVKDRFIDKEPVTIYRYLLIIMIFTLIQEIITLLLIFFVCFFRGIYCNIIIDSIVLGLYVYLILNIFAVLLRSIIYLYASNYKK